MRDLKTQERKVRVQFDFSEKSLKRLDELAERLDIPTRAEVVRRALSFYAGYIDALRKGDELLLKDKEGNIAKIIQPF